MDPNILLRHPAAGNTKTACIVQDLDALFPCYYLWVVDNLSGEVGRARGYPLTTDYGYAQAQLGQLVRELSVFPDRSTHDYRAVQMGG